MLILEIGFCRPKISRMHEFGDRRLKKLLRIQLLILTIFVLDRGVFFRAAHAMRGDDREWVKSVRVARLKARKRGLSEGRNEWKERADMFQHLLNKSNEENSRLNRENYGLKIAIKALGGKEA